MTTSALYQDRKDAGRQLADRLLLEEFDDPLVLGVPCGGVPVALEVAKKLEAPLDTIVVRKIGMPNNREYGIGAIAPGDVLLLNEAAIATLGITEAELAAVLSEEREEMERQITHYQSGGWGNVSPARTIIVIDDGLASGYSARAALEAVKLTYKPKRIVFASPVCARESIEGVQMLISDINCLLTPDELSSVGEWYTDFTQVTDEEVRACLTEGNRSRKN